MTNSKSFSKQISAKMHFIFQYFILGIALLEGSIIHANSNPKNNYSIIIGVDKMDKYQSHLNKYSNNLINRSSKTNIDRITAIAFAANHNIITIVNEQATRAKILDTLKSVGKSEASKVFIYFIGYGESTSDLNHDERASTNDQTFIAYDGLILDDEIFLVLNKFYHDKITTLITDLIHFKFNKSSPNLYLLDFNGRNESIAWAQTLENDCTLSSTESVNELVNLIYIGIVRDTTSMWDLSMQLVKIRHKSRINNRISKMTCRDVTCKLKPVYEKEQIFFYKELGLKINELKENTIFK